MKKIIAFILAAATMTTMLSACGSKKEKTEADNGMPTLRVFFSDDIVPDKDMVAEEVSKITREEIGANVEFVMFGSGEYTEKIPLLLASNEKMDIGFDAGWMDYVSRSRKGAYYDITELLKDKNKKLYDAVDEKLWKGVAVDGKVYGVPTYKETAEQWALYAETDFLKKNNIDPASIKTLEDAEVILKALKNDPERPGFMITPNDSQQNLYSSGEYVQVTENVAYIKNSEPDKIVNYFETDSYKKFVTLMHDWFNKGYIDANVATFKDDKAYNKYMGADGKMKMGMKLVSYSPFNEVAQKTLLGVDLTPLPLSKITTTNGSTSGSICCIYKKSENPELALKFLELWNTDARIKNLITYGIEGTHYTLDEKGKAVITDDSKKKYYNQNWKTGNTFIAKLTSEEPDNKFEKFKEFNAAAVEAPNLGFSPDTSKIEDKLSACKNVIKEYAPLLNCGVVDPNEYLPKFTAALKSAGSDEIVAEFQKQYDAWKKTNAK